MAGESELIDYELPDDERREQLLEAMALLIERGGWQPLVCSHIIEPTAEFFPDRWEPNERGVERLLRRLLGYAGLGGLGVRLVTYDQAERSYLDAQERVLGRRSGAQAWFAGIEDGRCRFGVDVDQLNDPENLIGVLAHEVAHAYRRHHGLCAANPSVEEYLTDLTTVYLGFGVLTANSALRFRTDLNVQPCDSISKCEV
jgi:hypothetical protein